LLFFSSGELTKSERQSFPITPKLTRFYCYLLSGFC
jgi:hypothetical protein